ncbi:imidazole glycerol phosphate synthase HisHF [Pluteus cervinus]|uniref:Imidazole glycerol phosphate synthase HisHF n=1 Tax=Pluteus cervinus TaxID=181527 RepID=A0ACD3BH02_9AGAR|nr:imidazole glycerol phosphate synthase HisHF [Pluteus cervinus]
MGLYLLDYGAGNVQSLANSLKKLGYHFTWVSHPDDFLKATSLVFPGVGAFETAVNHLVSRGLFEPLRQYVQSGKPYFGICIGMQILFQSSAESTVPGLGVIPSPVERFDDKEKAVPHIGWNAARPVSTQPDGPAQPPYYYFVHSYCAKHQPERHPEASGWAYTTTQYGDETFISSVRQGNIFGTQFHPEKSGPAGLALLGAWLANYREVALIHPIPASTLVSSPEFTLTKRIIACMDVRTNDEGDLVVTKGDQYDVREKVDPDPGTTTNPSGAVRNLGKPVALASRYYEAGADELCLLNITSFRLSPLQDQPMLAVVRAAAECVFVPLTIGGGIKDTTDPDGTKRSALEVAGAYFRAGADKVSIGSEAVYAVERLRAQGKPDGASAIETIAHTYGRQAVVVSVDPRRVYVDPKSYDGPYHDEIISGDTSGLENDKGKAWWYQCTVSGGREARQLSVVQLVQGVETLGAGEILLNSIDRDGTGLGFDIALVSLVKRSVKIPVVASSGAGASQHFVDLFKNTSAEAALAAGIFHRELVGISEVKERLMREGVRTRI